MRIDHVRTLKIVVMTSCLAACTGTATTDVVVTDARMDASGDIAEDVSTSLEASVDATSLRDCGTTPHRCGYPDETNTGVPAGTALVHVPRDATSGAGWTWDPRGNINVNTDGAVLDGLEVDGNIEVFAANVTIRNCRIVATGETWGVGLRHASGATITDCEIYSPVATGADRLSVGIKDIYGDTVGTRIERVNIYHASTGIQIANGVFRGNYIHDYGYADGDHLNGISVGGGDTMMLLVQHNTILDDHDQTDAIALFQDFGTEANKTIDDNLVAGGSYCIYGGDGGEATSNIHITRNRISTRFFPNGGTFGWLAHFEAGGAGNVVQGNIWDDTGESADDDWANHP